MRGNTHKVPYVSKTDRARGAAGAICNSLRVPAGTYPARARVLLPLVLLSVLYCVPKLVARRE
jgi:hypothetical protein